MLNLHAISFYIKINSFNGVDNMYSNKISETPQQLQITDPKELSWKRTAKKIKAVVIGALGSFVAFVGGQMIYGTLFKGLVALMITPHFLLGLHPVGLIAIGSGLLILGVALIIYAVRSYKKEKQPILLQQNLPAAAGPVKNNDYPAQQNNACPQCRVLNPAHYTYEKPQQPIHIYSQPQPAVPYVVIQQQSPPHQAGFQQADNQRGGGYPQFSKPTHLYSSATARR